MLKFNRDLKTDNLADQFGIEQELFDSVAKKWKDCFDEMDEGIETSFEKGLDFEQDGVEFDATDCMAIFFKHFPTQELQDIAMVQYLMRDINDRAKRTAAYVLKKKMFEEIKNARPKEDGGFSPDLL